MNHYDAIIIGTGAAGGIVACVLAEAGKHVLLLGCKYCVGFACPTDAKSGTQNTVIPRALATGNCELRTGTIVAAIQTDERGSVIGVSYMDNETRRQTARAKIVIVSAGAIESARLLLNSHSALHPAGLGNEPNSSRA